MDLNEIFVDIPHRIMVKLRPSQLIMYCQTMFNAQSNRPSSQRRAARAVAVPVADPVADKSWLVALLISLIMLILVVGNSGVIV
jgi:hypothetical protein